MGKKGRRPRNDARSRRHNKSDRGNWSSVQVFEGPPVGPDVVTASLDEVLAAIESVPADLDWRAIAERIVPLFQRVRPYPPGNPEPLRILVPPGLSVGFGIDVGPAFVNVDAGMVERWGLNEAELFARALDNLDRRMAAVSPDEVLDGSVGGESVRALQSSTGCASTYVLLPASLRRIFGSRPQQLIAPMRNLLISLPIDADRDFAAWLFDEFASQDPNCLAPAAFVIRETGLSVEPLGDAFGRA
jgi:hypothetical protein